MFQLQDLYDGSTLAENVKYPDGIPNPEVAAFPQRYGCVMAKAFGFARTAATTASSYNQYVYGQENVFPVLSREGIGLFHAQDPQNYVLCAEDIVRIVERENPSCPLNKFYGYDDNGNLLGYSLCEYCHDSTCEPCTSLNYLKCTLKTQT